jgi:pimeloyl-ACP methyl ester carboxylesterase
MDVAMVPELTLTCLAGSVGADRLLAVGPSLGTGVAALWGHCACLLTESFEVVGWDLPGHGAGAPATGSFSVADLADAVRRAATDLAHGRRASYAGVSLGGAVAFALATQPGPFDAVVSLASAPRIGEPAMWRERADLVRRAGTPVMVGSSAERWFAPGFTDREPETAGALLTSLAEVDPFSYACACEALAGFDATKASAVVPLHVVAGEQDQVLPPATVEQIPATSFHVLAGCGHLPPAEDPAAVAALLTDVLDPAAGAR